MPQALGTPFLLVLLVIAGRIESAVTQMVVWPWRSSDIFMNGSINVVHRMALHVLEGKTHCREISARLMFGNTRSAAVLALRSGTLPSGAQTRVDHLIKPLDINDVWPVRAQHESGQALLIRSMNVPF